MEVYSDGSAALLPSSSGGGRPGQPPGPGAAAASQVSGAGGGWARPGLAQLLALVLVKLVDDSPEVTHAVLWSRISSQRHAYHISLCRVAQRCWGEALRPAPSEEAHGAHVRSSTPRTACALWSVRQQI